MTRNGLLLADEVGLPTVASTRITLRWITPDDVPALFDVFGDPKVCRYWSRPAIADLDAAAALQREIHALFADRTLFQWGIAERQTNLLVGTCTLAGLSPEHDRAEVGFALRRDRWGQGYAGEALGVLVGFAFGSLGLRRLEAEADPRNRNSIRVLERTGFRGEGVRRERHMLCGEVQDAALFGLLRREWEAATRCLTEP